MQWKLLKEKNIFKKTKALNRTDFRQILEEKSMTYDEYPHKVKLMQVLACLRA